MTRFLMTTARTRRLESPHDTQNRVCYPLDVRPTRWFLPLFCLLALLAAPSARGQAPGSLESGFDPNVAGFSVTSVNGTAVQTDRRMILNGGFTNVGEMYRPYLARVYPDGSLDTGFSTNVVGGSVNGVAVQTDGKILLGGSFYKVGSVYRYRMARLLTNGSLDTTFNASADSAVFCLATQPDGKILVGGEFFAINGIRRWCIARV